MFHDGIPDFTPKFAIFSTFEMTSTRFVHGFNSLLTQNGLRFIGMRKNRRLSRNKEEAIPLSRRDTMISRKKNEKSFVAQIETKYRANFN
jgi:hypothetical protein